MARPVWKGSISFGLVSIPVGLHGAVREQRVRFNQLERGTSSRIRYRRVNEETGEEVPLERIVRGVPVGDGRYVVLDDEELAAAAPEQSRTIELQDFVAAGEIDPILYETPYYLAPATAAAGRPYALLAAALEQAGRVGIATFVLREREHLAAIRSQGGVLVLETMRFADEVRSRPSELEAIEDLEPRGRELEIALSLVESMAASFEPTRYRDTYRERLEAVVEAKARGEAIEVHEPAQQATNVVDLVSVLSRSVEEARRRRAGAAGEDAAAPGEGRGEPAEAVAEVQGKQPADQEQAYGDLSGLSRDALYQVAKELGVPGRSSMGRDALLEAVTSIRREGGGRVHRRAS